MLGRPDGEQHGDGLLGTDPSRKRNRATAPTWTSARTGPTGLWWWLAAIAAKSGSAGAGAASDPGFQPRGRVRGTHSEYRCAQVPSAMTASSPEFRASTSGWLSLATA